MNKAEELIACLEGEIAKRDEELAACRVAVENCELFRVRIAELEALSVTKVMLDIVPGDGDGYEVYAKSVSDVETKLGELGEENEELQFEREQLRAELSAIKAHGVVMPERKTKADYGVYIDEFADEAAAIYNAALDAVTRLNAAPAAPGAKP